MNLHYAFHTHVVVATKTDILPHCEANCLHSQSCIACLNITVLAGIRKNWKTGRQKLVDGVSFRETDIGRQSKTFTHLGTSTTMNSGYYKLVLSKEL